MGSNQAFEDWLANLHPDLPEIAKQLRVVANKNMPDAHEFIYCDAIGYSVSDSPFERICYIAPQRKEYVNFGFFFGAGLPDPKIHTRRTLSPSRRGEG